MGHILRTGRDILRATVRDKPLIKAPLVSIEGSLEQWKHTIAKRFPSVIKPRTRKMTVAITAQCNLRCVGCRYGRDFMPGHVLSLDMVKGLMDDGRAAGVEQVRLYGGEPLLHKELPAMIAHGVSIGLEVYVTTNGVLLEKRIDELYDAGLRDITLGYYGTGSRYDAYVQKDDRFVQMERGIAVTRERYGSEMDLQLNFLIMRPSCDLEALQDAWDFAERYDMAFHTDLVHYSLPYFTEGLDSEIQFRPEDAPALQAVTDRLIELKEQNPRRIPEAIQSIRSIPDWLMKGPDMRIPCDVYNMIWIGADGSVKLCYVTFDMGNLHDNRLSELINTETHTAATRSAFKLECPNCHCERDSRIRKDKPSMRKYSS